MKTQNTSRQRLGLLALLLSGVLFAATLLFRGPFIDPTVEAAGFARAVTSVNHVIRALGTMVANVLATLGVLALYSILAPSPAGRLGFAAMIAMVLHDELFPAFLGFNLAMPNSTEPIMPSKLPSPAMSCRGSISPGWTKWSSRRCTCTCTK